MEKTRYVILSREAHGKFWRPATYCRFYTDCYRYIPILRSHSDRLDILLSEDRTGERTKF